jgi:GNAT superfamily N-acetyltransferase
LILVFLSGQLAGGCVLATVIHDWPGLPDNGMFLCALVVARFAAGRGLGTKIINACEDAARKRGKRYIYLDCWDGIEFLKSYYQQEGFQKLEAVAYEDYFIRPFVKDIS